MATKPVCRLFFATRRTRVQQVTTSLEADAAARLLSESLLVLKSPCERCVSMTFSFRVAGVTYGGLAVTVYISHIDSRGRLKWGSERNDMKYNDENSHDTCMKFSYRVFPRIVFRAPWALSPSHVVLPPWSLGLLGAVETFCSSCHARLRGLPASRRSISGGVQTDGDDVRSTRLRLFRGGS